jgi:hypothetical protein
MSKPPGGSLPEVRELGNQRPLRVYSRSYVSLVWVSILLISGFAPVAVADQNMATVSTSAIISDHLEIITFLCGSLSAREKNQLTDEAAREISKDPRRWQHDYARTHADVMTLHKNDPELSTEIFEN